MEAQQPWEQSKLRLRRPRKTVSERLSSGMARVLSQHEARGKACQNM